MRECVRNLIRHFHGYGKTDLRCGGRVPLDGGDEFEIANHCESSAIYRFQSSGWGQESSDISVARYWFQKAHVVVIAF